MPVGVEMGYEGGLNLITQKHMEHFDAFWPGCGRGFAIQGS